MLRYEFLDDELRRGGEPPAVPMPHKTAKARSAVPLRPGSRSSLAPDIAKWRKQDALYETGPYAAARFEQMRPQLEAASKTTEPTRPEDLVSALMARDARRNLQHQPPAPSFDGAFGELFNKGT
jgi:hypothetical protein